MVIGRPAPIGAVTPGNRTTSRRGSTGIVRRSANLVSPSISHLTLPLGVWIALGASVGWLMGILRATGEGQSPAGVAGGLGRRHATGARPTGDDRGNLS